MNFSQLGWASGGPRSASGQISIVIRACNEDDDYDNNGDDDVVMMIMMMMMVIMMMMMMTIMMMMMRVDLICPGQHVCWQCN